MSQSDMIIRNAVLIGYARQLGNKPVWCGPKDEYAFPVYSGVVQVPEQDKVVEVVVKPTIDDRLQVVQARLEEAGLTDIKLDMSQGNSGRKVTEKLKTETLEFFEPYVNKELPSTTPGQSE